MSTSGRLEDSARELAERIVSSGSVVVATHIDADGISAASVASIALERRGIKHEVVFLKKLDDEAISNLRRRSESSLVWLTDLGSAYASKFEGANVIISDHHELDDGCQEKGRSVQKTLFDCGKVGHINPCFFGYAGARDISGAGLAFHIAVQIDKENKDLASLPVIGAIGDMQDADARRLTGLNAAIVDTGVKTGKIRRTKDLRFFGLETRSLVKLLEYASDPFLPGLTGNQTGCEEFLKMLKIPSLDDRGPRRWSGLESQEKNRIISALSRLILENGGGQKEVERLTGEVYVFPAEEIGSPTREAREFATLLNSCGRNDMPHLGLEICKGDREASLGEALQTLREHRERLSNALMFVREMGVAQLSSIQHFHCADQVKDTLVGAIAGILLGSGEVDRRKPILGFALSKEDNGEFKVKVSIRTTQEMVESGVNVSTAARKAAQALGGVGGGHNVAAGATIPLGKEDDFLAMMDREIGEQLKAHDCE